MSNWLQRGLVFAAAMVVVRLIQGVLINAFEAYAGLISVALVAVFVVAVVAWGLVDGRGDATANPDPDRRRDLAMTWLGAGLLAGAVSGAVSWLISLVYSALYTGGLFNELTSFAAFTALLVFVPAMGGVVVGRWQVDRELAKAPVRHHGLAAHDGAHDEEQADTDVFAAVGAGQAQDSATAARAAEAAEGEAATTPVGGDTEWPTEEFPADAEYPEYPENPENPAGR